MTDAPATRLWTPEGFIEDDWTHVESAEALSGNGRFILPLAAFLEMSGEAREAAADRIGVQILPGEELSEIEPYLGSLPLVALAFPAFSDGRSFSKAELLRSRYGFEKIVRATGQVLVDQLPHMLRLGFTEFEISNPTLLKRLEEGVTGGIPFYYQPTVKPAEGHQAYSWRRLKQ
ncbi:DUF934 domain-containing protein [Mesorhizobium sp. RP14(2022)]|uniref:DUF934 domain-containing protein n=1 Tax=Mesorhizobium liriopis TaxID=2953882 RepID=A0ABT1C488_9HYPH|nr:DUF934 domain-containing protein [Mesorhizobium liriopis]MCO6049468.1 DUF934 domain-containing protein [Mesorhizobium liriopis]